MTPRNHGSERFLDEYANTASAGSIIAFHKHRQDLRHGDRGLICSFGAGYSIGSLIVKKVSRRLRRRRSARRVYSENDHEQRTPARIEGP